MSHEEAVEVARITITRHLSLTDDVVHITCSDDLRVMDGAGMLVMAMDTWMRTHGFRDEADEWLADGGEDE